MNTLEVVNAYKSLTFVERAFRSLLEHKPEAIDDWANALRRRFDNRPVAVCLETRRGR
jgi:hypothetical protein